jgi:signal transduction histidine kinase
MSMDQKIREELHSSKPKIWLFITLILVLIIIGVYSIYAIGKSEDRRLREEFSIRAQNIAEAIDSEYVKTLRGDLLDTYSSDYAYLKDMLTRVKEVDPDVRFTYLMGLRNNELFFYADSEPSDSEDYSAPGDVYSDATQEEYDLFENKQSYVLGPYEDDWGNWVSASSPVIDQSTGKVIASFGIDISSDRWIRQLRAVQAIPATILAALIIILVLFFFNRVKTAFFISKLEKYNEIIRQFASFASHQLRTPLTAIKWTTETLMKDAGSNLNLEQKKLLAKISDLDKTMLNLIKDFLDMSSVEREGKIVPHKELLDLNKLTTKAVMDNNDAAMKKQITVIVTNKLPEDFRISVDPDQIYSCLDNLVSNAIKYSHPGSNIHISLCLENNKCVVAVRDTGVGVPSKDQRRLFTSFFRGSNVSTEIAGTGIGLYLVKLIMEAHDGDIEFDSELNKGSEFRLIFKM